MRGKASGFSLIELIVVVVILGIMALLAFEKSTEITHARSLLAAHELMVNLRHIRNAAMQSERTTRITFDLGSSSYAVHMEDPGAPGGYAPLANPSDQSDWSVSIPQRFPGVSLDAVDLDGGSVLFFKGTNGIPCGDGGSGLTDSGTLVFNSGLTVTIAPETGYVEISE